MSKSWIILGILLALAGQVSAEKKTDGVKPPEPATLRVKVDGLSCPFCVYGLEKHLKRVKCVDKVKTFVDEGIAVLQLNRKEPIDAQAVREAVKKGGFTPRKTTLTASGRMLRENKKWVFRVQGSDTVMFLAGNEKLRELEKKTLIDREITLSGTLEGGGPVKGHDEHPATLTIEEYSLAIEKQSE